MLPQSPHRTLIQVWLFNVINVIKASGRLLKPPRSRWSRSIRYLAHKRTRSPLHARTLTHTHTHTHINHPRTYTSFHISCLTSVLAAGQLLANTCYSESFTPSPPLRTCIASANMLGPHGATGSKSVTVATGSKSVTRRSSQATSTYRY